MTGLPDTQCLMLRHKTCLLSLVLFNVLLGATYAQDLKSEWIGLNYLKGPTYERVQAAQNIVAENK